MLRRSLRFTLRNGFISAVPLFLLAASVTARAQSWRVTVNAAQGRYTLQLRQPGEPAWVLQGATGAALQQVSLRTGHDRLGPYREVRLRWSRRQIPLQGTIRAYTRTPAVSFWIRYPQGAHFSPGAISAFPDFQRLPSGLHVLSYANHAFSPPAFSAIQASTPWVLFDQNFHTLVLSPANHFQVATLRGDGLTTAAVSLNSGVNQIEDGFRQHTLLVYGNGIGHTMDAWGSLLQKLSGRVAASNTADDSLRYLGYWTDNGATYYYHYDPQLGYTGTLLAELRHLKRQGIPVRYLQLDSWWYQKDPVSYDGTPLKAKNPNFRLSRWNVYGGVWLYRASRQLFPHGLLAFHHQSGMPFVVHGRWISQRSPYHRRYRIAGIAPIDPAYWNRTANYLRGNGVVTYEQDWLNVIRHYSGFASHPGLGGQFFRNMAAALAARHMTMQYCMPVPSEILEESRFSNLTTSRVSNDHFLRAHWYPFVFTSQFAAAMGAHPWADVCDSPDADAVLLQTLSTGPVGFGDAIGKENKVNLMQAVRADGVLIKPDAPLVPLDQSYLDGALGAHVPTLAATFTQRGNVRTAYVFAFARRAADRGPVRFTAAAVGLRGPMYVYDYFSHGAQLVAAGAAYSGALGAEDASYDVCASPGASGIALLGDADKFVGTGKSRITSLHDSRQGLSAKVVFAANEPAVTLFGFAAKKPTLRMRRGTADRLTYNPETREFRVTVHPQARNAELTLREP